MLCKGTCSCWSSSDFPSCFTLTALYVILLLDLQPPSMCCFIELLSKIDRVISAVLREEERIKRRREGFKTLTALCLRTETHSKGKVGQQRFHYIECPLLCTAKVLINGNDPTSFFLGQKGRQRWLNWFFWSNHMRTVFFFFENNFNQCNIITTQTLIHFLPPLSPELLGSKGRRVLLEHISAVIGEGGVHPAQVVSSSQGHRKTKKNNYLQTPRPTDNF